MRGTVGRMYYTIFEWELLNGKPLTTPRLHVAELKLKLKFNQKTGGAFWQNLFYNESVASPNSLKVR